MRECEQLKRALGVPSDSKKTKSNNNDDRNGGQSFGIVTVDLINVITMIAGPIIIMMTGIDVIIAATITMMTDATITVATTITIGVTTAGMVAAKTSATTGEMTDVMIDVAKMTIIATTTIAKSGLYHHCLKGATPMVRSSRLTERSTSSSVVAKRPKATNRSDQMQGRSGMSTPKPHSLCVGSSSQSLSLRKIIGSTSPTPRHTRWSLTP
jgi:hypothetical protein